MTQGASKVPSIKDVARLAGVSEQTVSRTMHGSAAVRPETRERVMKAVRELGYRPSSAGRSLRRGSYKAFGLAMGNITETGNLSRLESFVEAAERHDYTISFLKMDREHPLELAEASRRMASLPVDGMIYVLNRMPADFLSFEPLPGLPTVIVSMEEHPVCPTVDSDQRGTAMRVVRYLIEHGHEKIWHIGGPVRSLAGLQREEGWRHALALAGVEPFEVLRGDWSSQSGYDAGLKIADAAAEDRCSAVFASNDAMAYGCYCALRDRGLSVPEDVSLVGVDDVLETLVPHAGITSVRFDNNKIAAWAVERLVAAEGASCPAAHQLFPGEIIERTSVRALG